MAKKQIIFLVQPHTNLLDLGNASHAFLEAKEGGLDIDITFCALSKNIVSTLGIQLSNIKLYSEIKINKGDYLIVISTSIHYILSESYYHPKDFIYWINNLYNNSVNICALCNGAFLLGKAGLLNNIKCTTHWKRTKELKQLYPLALVHENIIYVEDKNIITSAGGASGVDVSLYIITKLKDEQFSHYIARELVVYQRRNGEDKQYSVFTEKRNHVHTGIHKAQDYIHQQLHKGIRLEDLADIANMSYRNFCRIFKKEIQFTVLEYVNLVRKERAKQLLLNPDLSKRQVANLIGLKSERQLNRIINNNGGYEKNYKQPC